MDRRSFMLSMVIGTVGLIMGRGSCGDVAAKPNLLIIHTDEHNFRTLGCYRDTLPPEQAFMWGKNVVETPHIDSLAREGVLCERFYATTPLCSPSRASFVSGMYPQNTPVNTNTVRMSDDIVTFAEVLSKKGYSTGYAGKWHLEGRGRPPGWAPARKCGFNDNRYMFDKGHWKRIEDGPEGPIIAGGKNDYSVEGADDKSFTTDWLTDKAIDFINTNRSKPFCYMLSIPDPHGPDSVRPPYDTMFEEMTFEKPRNAKEMQGGCPSWAAPRPKGLGQSQYYGMVKCIDDNVGKLLGVLKTNGLMDKTIVVFTSDHGDLRGEHNRQNKSVPFEASSKIPFIIRYPKKLKAGLRVKQAMGVVDFMPTILSLMEVEGSGNEEGRDASELLLTGKAPRSWRDVIFTRGAWEKREQFSKGSSWIAAFTSRYKLVLSAYDDPWLLDLEQDPDELKNFFSEESKRKLIRELARELRAYGQKYKDPGIDNPRVKADLDWCIFGQGAYQSNG